MREYEECAICGRPCGPRLSTGHNGASICHFACAIENAYWNRREDPNGCPEYKHAVAVRNEQIAAEAAP